MAPRPRPNLLDWGAFPFGPCSPRRANFLLAPRQPRPASIPTRRFHRLPRHRVLVELSATLKEFNPQTSTLPRCAFTMSLSLR
jgi:hypothetical protein